ncbi:hypothetical protein ACFBZI_10565 [Moraxella sp. ZJ142]|uniref:hypothetical protein n=1 Tax=Moraxella marmotae TaxID=3344520 RepID=UPI0035D4771C
MIYVSDKYLLRSFQTAIITLLFPTTQLTNLGESQAILEQSDDGVNWKPLASISPKDTTNITINSHYIRLNSDTMVYAYNEGIGITPQPKPKANDSGDGTANVDLSAYYTKSEVDAQLLAMVEQLVNGADKDSDSFKELADKIVELDTQTYETINQVSQTIQSVQTQLDTQKDDNYYLKNRAIVYKTDNIPKYHHLEQSNEMLKIATYNDRNSKYDNAWLVLPKYYLVEDKLGADTQFYYFQYGTEWRVPNAIIPDSPSGQALVFYFDDWIINKFKKEYRSDTVIATQVEIETGSGKQLTAMYGKDAKTGVYKKLNTTFEDNVTRLENINIDELQDCIIYGLSINNLYNGTDDIPTWIGIYVGDNYHGFKVIYDPSIAAPP